MDPIVSQIATELGVRAAQVHSAVELLDGGATVPFIARYRKEATAGLDDNQLRELEVRLGYLRELHERRTAVLASIDEQGKLTPELRAAIGAAATKQLLEDLYLPYKPKRRSKGLIAREAGIEPLADRLLADPALDPLAAAEAFAAQRDGGWTALAEAGFADARAVLDGVRDILAERWAEDAVLVGKLRDWLWAEGRLRAKLQAGKDENAPEVAKLRDYFDFDEALRSVPSHRALAVFRARAQDILELRLAPPDEADAADAAKAIVSAAEGRIALHLGWRHAGRAADDLLRKAIAWTWKVKLSLSLERDLFARLREQAEDVAIKVFADNLRDLLLAAPAGRRAAASRWSRSRPAGVR